MVSSLNFWKLGILVPVCFGTRLGGSFAAPKGVSKRIGCQNGCGDGHGRCELPAILRLTMRARLWPPWSLPFCDAIFVPPRPKTPKPQKVSEKSPERSWDPQTADPPKDPKNVREVKKIAGSNYFLDCSDFFRTFSCVQVGGPKHNSVTFFDTFRGLVLGSVDGRRVSNSCGEKNGVFAFALFCPLSHCPHQVGGTEHSELPSADCLGAKVWAHRALEGLSKSGTKLSESLFWCSVVFMYHSLQNHYTHEIIIFELFRGLYYSFRGSSN